jgi:hypothetical protein
MARWRRAQRLAEAVNRTVPVRRGNIIAATMTIQSAIAAKSVILWCTPCPAVRQA